VRPLSCRRRLHSLDCSAGSYAAASSTGLTFLSHFPSSLTGFCLFFSLSLLFVRGGHVYQRDQVVRVFTMFGRDILVCSRIYCLSRLRWSFLSFLPLIPLNKLLISLLFSPSGGYSSSASSPFCAVCDQGQFSLNGSAACTPCPIGHYSSAFGSTECFDCPFGKYASATGQPFCTDCSTGWSDSFVFQRL
jgi:hypothetical protein